MWIKTGLVTKKIHATMVCYKGGKGTCNNICYKDTNKHQGIVTKRQGLIQKGINTILFPKNEIRSFVTKIEAT